MTQPNPKADSQSQAEALRQQLTKLVQHMIPVPDETVTEDDEGNEIYIGYEERKAENEADVLHYTDKLLKLVTAYAATVEREAETKGVGLGYTLASEKLFVDVADFHKFTEELAGGPIWTHQFADKKTWDKLREMYETQRLAALQGPQDGDAE